MRTVQYIPRATEKAYVAQTKNQYIFYVPKDASKQEIAKAIAEAFKVTIIDVRTATRKGKATRFSRGRHAYPGITYRQDHKVAYITVKDGDKIPVFEDETSSKDDAKKSKKADKAEASKATSEKATAKSTEKTAKAKKTTKKTEKESK